MKILYLGTRKEILEKCYQMGFEIVYSLVIEGSNAEVFLKQKGYHYDIINKENKDQMLKKLLEYEYHIAVSCGFPYIIPDEIIQSVGIYKIINFHPSLLPQYIGLHPISGVLLKGGKKTGVTCHFIDMGLDTGNIILKKEIELSEDIDADLLYQILFKLEGEVFVEVCKILMENSYIYSGKKQTGKCVTYYRKKLDRCINFNTMNTYTILNIIRAFANPRLGSYITDGSNKYLVYLAERIVNKYLIQEYINEKAGKVLICSNFWIIVKTLDGIIKIHREESWNNMTEGIQFV